jgi:hypothetical protein
MNMHYIHHHYKTNSQKLSFLNYLYMLNNFNLYSCEIIIVHHEIYSISRDIIGRK